MVSRLPIHHHPTTATPTRSPPNGWLRVFQDPHRSPDLVVVHTPAHHWPERGGHLGEHGSLDAAQSRAPLLLSGSRRLPSAACLTAPPGWSTSHRRSRTCAAYRCRTRTGGRCWSWSRPARATPSGLLWDGTNSNDLIDLATAGELPAVAHNFLEQGCALTGGADRGVPQRHADQPHVRIDRCGVRPRHGILHNTFWDRQAGSADCRERGKHVARGV